MQKEKRVIWRKMKKNTNPKVDILTKYNGICDKVRQAIYDYECSLEKKFFENESFSKFYTFVNRHLKGHRVIPTLKNIHLNSDAVTDYDKAEELNNSFASVFTKFNDLQLNQVSTRF